MKIIVLSILFTSCSLFKTENTDYSSKYITGNNLESMTSEQIENKISKNISMNGGQYQLKITPLSKPLIERRAKEKLHTLAVENQLSKKMVETMINDLSNEKICFDVEIDVVRFDKVRNLSEWKISLKDDKNNILPMKWLDSYRWEQPILSMKRSPNGAIENWYNKGTACVTNAPIELEKGFSVVVEPSVVQWPFGKKAEAEWVFNQVKVVNGQKVEVRKKKNSYKKYRGY